MQKNFVALLLCAALSTQGKAQLFDRIKNKVNQKINDAVDKTIDNAGKKKQNASTSTSTSTADTTAGTNAAVVKTPNSTQTPATDTSLQVSEDLKSYSKFDFVPGEKIIYEENFSQDDIGEFPLKWNTDANAEVATLNNQSGKWLRIAQEGYFFPESIPSLPDNFTFQVDIMCNNEIATIGSLKIIITPEKSANSLLHGATSQGISLNFEPNGGIGGILGYQTDSHKSGIDIIKDVDPFQEFSVKDKKIKATVYVWKQKQRVRIYVNSIKVVDLPRALDADMVLNSILFHAYAPDFQAKGGAFFLTNLRLAVGAPDTRTKLITEGKFVSHGILFNTNSDVVQAPSYGALEDIANVLKENATVKVQIVGHTDNVGDDATNMDLSKRRAEAVKNALTNTFGIAADRLETDGKGKTQPIDTNDTSEGRANNRRVEFIKL